MKKKDVVIRISDENHKRLKSIYGELEMTTNQVVERMLDTAELVRDGDMVYLVDDKCFQDISEARGESIMIAVKNKDVPSWPKVAVIVGSDNG